MPIDPELLKELQKRGLPVPEQRPPIARPGAEDQPAATAPAGGAREELNRRASAQSQKLTDEANAPSAIGSFFRSLVKGAGDPVESGAAIGAKMMAAGPEEGAGAFDVPEQRQATAAAVPKTLERGEAEYQASPGVQAHPLASGLGRFTGAAAASAPLMAVPGASGVGTGLAVRSALGAGQGFATGGVPGAIAGGLTGGLGGVIGPRIDPALEYIQQKVPQLAEMVTGKLGRTAESFQKAFGHWVLDPINESLKPTIKVGHDLVNEVGDKLDDAYNKVLPRVTFRAGEVDPETGQSFKSGLPALSAKVPTSHTADWNRLIQREIVDRLDANGNMTGREYKNAISEVGKLAKTYSGERANADQELYGKALRNLQASMRDTLALHNPEESATLRQIDDAWSRLVRLEEASGRRVASNGEFTPNDVLYAARKGFGNRMFSRGENVGQAFGRAGNDLLAKRPPAFGRYMSDVIGQGAGAAAGHALGAAIGGPVVGYAGAGSGAAIGSGMAGAAREAAGRLRVTPGMRKTGEIISRIAPVTGGTAPSAATLANRRMKAAQKIGEAKTELFKAKTSDLSNYQNLRQKLADAQAEYQELGGRA